MLSKSIPIGLFVLLNNRTIEQKSSGRVGKAFFGRLRAVWEIGEDFSMGGYGRLGNQWVDKKKEKI